MTGFANDRSRLYAVPDGWSSMSDLTELSDSDDDDDDDDDDDSEISSDSDDEVHAIFFEIAAS